MRHFQVPVLALLAVIALELGSISMKLPTPTVQAQLSAPAALPELTAEHMALKRQLDTLSQKVDVVTSKTDTLMTNMKNYDEKDRNRFIHLSRIVYFCAAGNTPTACQQEFNKPDW